MENSSLVVVFGGSLGARTINAAAVGALDDLPDDRPVQVRHIVGRRDHADVLERVGAARASAVRYVPIEYENDMATLYAAADLVVCRAGATSCAELAVTGTPSVLVPLPGAPGDHQTANARALERAGGAEVIADGDFDAQALVDVFDRLLRDRARLREMGTRAKAISRPDAAAAVVDLIEQHASGVRVP